MEVDSTSLMSKDQKRNELRRKLREKITGMRQPKKQVTQKTQNQMTSQLKTEIKKMSEDDRITKRMIELYAKVTDTYNKVKIPSPLELFNNQDLAKQKFKEYLSNLIKTCGENNIPKEKFISDYLNSEYTQYHVAVLGKDIVPDKLRDDVYCC